MTASKRVIWMALGAIALTATLVGGLKSATPDNNVPATSNSQEWPQATGNLGNTRYSTLSQINKDTIKNLSGAWVSDKFDDAGSSRVTPVVKDGLMFVTGGAKVYALDPATGKTVWKYQTVGMPPGAAGARQNQNNGRGPNGSPNSQGVAAGDGKIFVGLTDAQMIALDQKTGKLVWAHPGLGDATPIMRCGISESPVYANGVIYTGLSCGEGRYIGEAVALDAKDGHEIWRWSAIPAVGEPGHGSWSENPKNDTWKMGGADVWQPPVVDLDDNLVIYGTGNPSPNRVGDIRPGDNLYSCSIVGLDMKTGKMRWYFQFAHHDLWENDLAVPPVLYDKQVNGKTQKILAMIRPDGTIFQFNPATGKSLVPIEERKVRQSPLYKTSPTQPYPLGKDSLIQRPCSSWKAPEGFLMRCEFFQPPTDDPPNVIVPGPGVRSAAMSYDPNSGLLFLQGEDRAEWEWNSNRPSTWEWPSGYMTQRIPGIDKQAVNIYEAVDPNAYKIVWRKEMRLPTSHYGVGGFLSTAGGVAFHRMEDGTFVAFDTKTGDDVWQFQTGVAGTNTASPMTYEIGGQQYVAVVEESMVWAFKLGGPVAQRPAPPLPALDENRILEGPTAQDVQLIRMSAPDDYDYRHDINPMKDRVKVGTAVTFLNNGSEDHTFVAMDGSWTTGTVIPRQTVAITFDKPGVFLYHCKEHPWSYGLITVVENQPAGGAAAATVGGASFAGQADRGKMAYQQNCAVCHQADLSGSDMIPALAGGGFMGRWQGKGGKDLFDKTRTTMPTNAPGSLSPQTYLDLVAYILQVNGASQPREVSADTVNAITLR